MHHSVTERVSPSVCLSEPLRCLYLHVPGNVGADLFSWDENRSHKNKKIIQQRIRERGSR